MRLIRVSKHCRRPRLAIKGCESFSSTLVALRNSSGLFGLGESMLLCSESLQCSNKDLDRSTSRSQAVIFEKQKRGLSGSIKSAKGVQLLFRSSLPRLIEGHNET